MNKFSLSFKVWKFENQYLQQKWKATSAQFTYATIGLLFGFLSRVINAHITNNFSLYFFKLGFLLYIAFQFGFVRWKPTFGRIGFILLNAIVIFYEQLESEEVNINTNYNISNLRGQNMMAINILLMQTGEFVDAAIQIIAISLYQILKAYLSGSSKGQYTIQEIFGAIILRSYLFYFIYQVNKAKRSQFLLTMVETCWDKIFLQLIKNPFILVKFNYQNFAFTVDNANQLPFFIQYDQQDPLQRNKFKFPEAHFFLQKAMIGKITLQRYIYEQIKKFQMTLQNVFNERVYVKFKNRELFIIYSVFQAEEPIILIQIEQFKRLKTKTPTFKVDYFAKYTNEMIKFLDHAVQKFSNYKPIKVSMRKLIFFQCLDQIQKKQYIVQQLNIEGIITKLKSIYSENLVIIAVYDSFKGQIETFSNIFLLFFILVINCSRNKKIILHIQQFEDEFFQFEIESSFKPKKFQKFYDKLSPQFQLILTDIEYSKKCKFMQQQQGLTSVYLISRYNPLLYNSE